MQEKEASLIRFGISMPEDLAASFDRMIADQGYGNRSEAVRDLVRKALLTSDSHMAGQTAAGTIVMVYDHHVTDLAVSLIQLQHSFHHEIISTMHIHLNHEQCLEVIIVKGTVQRLREITNRIQVQKGVLFAELSVSYIDQGQAGGGHEHA